MSSPDNPAYQEMEIDPDWKVSEIRNMTVRDLRNAIKDLHDDVPIIYDTGTQGWPIDQWGIFDDGLNLFANGDSIDR